ncbi:hypothetical protein FNH22_11910 [Fulvivirga sp. M361]|uniref:hypothetical protein n=1 Tax=Fulvivirga sp. M361 TaxID=2594266 RepID=UPI00117B03EA|nr:hypothetical protein [Fulvivirga sp. M361]TRX59221.1 hypothetical protein FNH22_11910 [Fulvivirga sp. M361]
MKYLFPIKRVIHTAWFLMLLVGQSCQNQAPNVQLIGFEFDQKSPSAHGLNKILLALASKEVAIEEHPEPVNVEPAYYIFAGLASQENKATQLLKEISQPLPEGKEALLIKKTTYNEKPALILCGSDEVGLMYAALDVAKRISWSDHNADIFEYVKDASETPDVKERAVSAGTFHRNYFEQRLYDSLYWEKYFDMMAENRLNQFLLIFGYKNNQYREPNFTAPVYPNFFNVDEFPYVKMSNMTMEKQQKNTRALKKIIALAHSRGIEFGVGLWDQIDRDRRYREMVKADSDIPAGLPANIIWGLTKENLIPYTKIAMRKFFRTFPEIDLVQFRMHWESGISGEVASAFWKETFNIIKEEIPDSKIEARAKDVPDETLFDGVDTGMDFRVATKHWMEQMGMPYHPTHINRDNQFDRRHGYADMLRYPKKYGFKWRVWSGGTTRLFLWGDPQWVRLFSEGSHLYDAAGFEFNEPLYFKMNGSKHDAQVSELLNPGYKYYTYEFERYWHYYQLMGRVAYNANTPSDLWEMEFANRFGEEAGPLLMDGLHEASKILPKIVTASYLYPRFMSPQGWPELQRMEDLKHFAKHSRPSDIQQFTSPKEEAEQILNGKFPVRRNASQVSDWFLQTSQSILSRVKRAEELVGDKQTKEFVSTITDLKMLAHLASYHSHRLKAAVYYNLYTKTGDLTSFDKALALEEQAVEEYGNLVASAGNIYNSQLDFGSNKALFPGHWRNEHQRLVDELESIKEDRKTIQDSIGLKRLFVHVPVQRGLPDESMEISATIISKKSIKSARVMVATEGEEFRSVEMSVSHGIGFAEIANSGPEGILKYYIEIDEGSGGKTYLPKGGTKSAYQVIISDDNEAPVVDLDRITTAKPNEKLKVSAKVTDGSGLKRVSLRYRRLSQFEDYQSAQMTYEAGSGKYEADIPSEFFDGKYDVMYFIEVMDSKGNGRMYPDMETERPYVVVHLDRQGKFPTGQLSSEK